MTDKEKAFNAIISKGYLILDFVMDDYPNFKELKKFSGVGQGMLRNNIEEIKSAFEEIEIEIDFLQLPTGEIALYDIKVYNRAASELYLKIKKEVANKEY